MLSDSFAYALRSLAKRRLRSWLTIIGIFIGIATVVSLISLGEGLQQAVAEQFATLGSDTVSVQPRGTTFGPPGLGATVQLTKDDLDVVKRAQHVEVATGRLLIPVTVEHKRKEQIGFVATLPEDTAERALAENFLDPVVVEGRFLRDDDRGKATIGATVADNWGSVEDVQIGNKITVNGTQVEVVGILKKKGLPAADWSIIMNEQDARDLLDNQEEYSIILSKVDDIENIALAKQAIAKDLRKFRDVDERKEDFDVETSEDLLATFTTVLTMITAVLSGIAAISLLVGGIGITNTMYTAVVERTKEIGIMKAIGATNEQVLQLFLIESGLLGMVGGLIGVVLGVGFSKLVEFGAAQALGPSVLQATSPAWLIIGALVFSFLVGTISGILPARQAANLPPVEALR